MSRAIPPQDVRDEVQRMREALRAAARGNRLSHAQIEEALGMSAGSLNVIFTGKIELRVAHVFGILRAIGCPSWKFFRDLQRSESTATLQDEVTRGADDRARGPAASL